MQYEFFGYRFNQHSILVLKASEQQNAGTEPIVSEATPDVPSKRVDSSYLSKLTQYLTRNAFAKIF